MGGIFSAPKPPAAPSPAEQAAAQQVTQLTPQGNLIYGKTDASGKFTPSTGHTAVRLDESPFQKQLRLLGEGLSIDLGGQVVNQFGQGGLTQLENDFSGQQQAAGNNLFQAGVSRMQPQFDLQRSRTEQRLADQGIPMNSPAYRNEMNRLEESQNEQLSRLSLDAALSSGQEQNRLQGLASTQRAQQFSELGALLGFQPSFQPMPTTGVDLNASYASQLGGYNARLAGQQQQAQNIGALAQTGAFLLSDIRTKENITPLGTENGHNIYAFNYIGDDKVYIGVMAQEVEQTNPKAVKEIGGIKHVNYDAIGVQFRSAA
jgi:hypothetical protein